MSRRKGPWRRHGRGPARRLRDVPILPTLVTLGNTFCGFLAIAYVADALAAPPDAITASGKALLRENRVVLACWLIMIAWNKANVNRAATIAHDIYKRLIIPKKKLYVENT